jgi:Periplasmic copper-binding protein (NosD)
MTVFRYVGAAAVFALAAPAAAHATEPACGATITSDVRLRADLARCPGDGLVIGADGITVDLSRHTVAGTGAGAGLRLAGHRGVKIRGGTVTGFARGIDVLDGATANSVEGVQSTGNRTGIAFTASDGNTVRLSSLSANAVTGVLVFGSAGTRVLANRVADNAGNGIAVVEGSTRTLVSANDIRGAVTGLWIDTSDRNTLTLNRVSGAGDGVQVAGDGNVLTGNLVDGSVGGCEGCTGYGIGVLSGTGNVLKANVVTRSAADGIAVAAPGTALGLNVALKNAALGINAVGGVRDLGGNRASGNGNAAQCVGVRCSSRGRPGHGRSDRTRRR